MSIDETLMPWDLCPACGYAFDMASAIEALGSPSPGDISLCLSCGAILVFGMDLRVLLAPAMVNLSLRAAIAREWILKRGPLPARGTRS